MNEKIVKEKKNKRKYVIMVLVVLILLIALAYAAFVSVLNITGTATATAKWDLHFANAKFDGETAATTGDNIAVILPDKKNLTVGVTLEKPGDTHTITVDIENNGSLDAKVKDFIITEPAGATKTISANKGIYQKGVIKMTLDQISTGDILSKTSGVSTYNMVFEWVDGNLSEYTEGSVTTVNQTADFTITFDYEQNN